MKQEPDSLVARALKILKGGHREPSDKVLIEPATRNARPVDWEAATDWPSAWRELAALTSGLTADDPRLPVVMAALNACDDAYLGGDWVAFCHAAARVRNAM